MGGLPAALSVFLLSFWGRPESILNLAWSIAFTQMYALPAALSVAVGHREPWLKQLKPNHIGGTMRPAQAAPSFSPYYIEFEEYFGGYNFGGGNAQLDFRDMKFDWACG